MWTKLISWVLSVVLFVCSLLGIPFGKPGDDTISYNKSQTVVTVSLDENPSTGYAWQYAVADESVVQNCGDTYSSDAPAGIAGAGGIRALSFLGLQAGTTTVTFTYLRAWETDPPIRTVVVEITVAENRTVSAKVIASSEDA